MVVSGGPFVRVHNSVLEKPPFLLDAKRQDELPDSLLTNVFARIRFNVHQPLHGLTAAESTATILDGVCAFFFCLAVTQVSLGLGRIGSFAVHKWGRPAVSVVAICPACMDGVAIHPDRVETQVRCGTCGLSYRASEIRPTAMNQAGLSELKIHAIRSARMWQKANGLTDSQMRIIAASVAQAFC